MSSKKFWLIICLVVTLLSSCNHKSTVLDLQEIKQDHLAYNKSVITRKRQLPQKIQFYRDREYNKKFYRPWTLKKHSTSKETIGWAFKFFKESPGFGENRQERDKEWIEALEKNADLNAFPNRVKKAITLNNTSFRLLPTKKPHFKHFKHLGEGFPFDNLQNSSIPANTPILITQITKDKSWVYAETSYASGWISIRDIAYAGPKFIRKFTYPNKHVAVTKEKIPVYSDTDQFLFNSNIGMIFPKISQTKKDFYIWTARSNANRFAYAQKARVTRKASVNKPMPLTTSRLVRLSNRLLDQSYGWGGLYSNRDCSAMIRDLFTPFGIWLPRNSKAQAYKTGTYFSFKGLSDEQKEQMILNNGIPYLTLIWFPGHIMLYIGETENKALIFHNIWGLRTKEEGERKIIGRAVITTLYPEKGIKKYDPDNTFIKRIEGMTLLVPRFEK